MKRVLQGVAARRHLLADAGHCLDEPLGLLPSFKSANEDDFEGSVHRGGLGDSRGQSARPEFGNDSILDHSKDPPPDTRRQAILGSLVGYDEALGLTLRVDRAWQSVSQAPGKVLRSAVSSRLQEAKAWGYSIAPFIGPMTR